MLALYRHLQLNLVSAVFLLLGCHANQDMAQNDGAWDGSRSAETNQAVSSVKQSSSTGGNSAQYALPLPPPAPPRSGNGGSGSAPAQTGGSGGSTVVLSNAQAENLRDMTMITEDRQAKLQQAIKTQSLVDDPNGQWAISATASTTFATLLPNRNPNDTAWTAQAAVGTPNADPTGYAGSGWSPGESRGGRDWLELRYARPVHATGVRVNFISGPGVVIKIDGIDPQGQRHTLWQGRDETTYVPHQSNWFEIHIPRTPFTVSALRLTIATTVSSERISIDGVQLLGQ